MADEEAFKTHYRGHVETADARARDYPIFRQRMQHWAMIRYSAWPQQQSDPLRKEAIKRAADFKGSEDDWRDWADVRAAKSYTLGTVIESESEGVGTSEDGSPLQESIDLTQYRSGDSQGQADEEEVISSAALRKFYGDNSDEAERYGSTVLSGDDDDDSDDAPPVQTARRPRRRLRAPLVIDSDSELSESDLSASESESGSESASESESESDGDYYGDTDSSDAGAWPTGFTSSESSDYDRWASDSSDDDDDSSDDTDDSKDDAQGEGLQFPFDDM